MKKKLLIVGVILLFGAGIIPTAASQSDVQRQSVQTRDIVWSENFDSYTTGSGLHGQGGWFGWGDSALADAIITSDQARSTPNSVEVKEDSDMVHTWTGINTGNVIFTTWMYIPVDFTGQSYFILLSEYNGDSSFWSAQIRFDSEFAIVESEHEGEQLNLITGEWVELRVEIDLTADWQKIYYDDDLLTEKSWTNGVSQGGPLQLGGVDLFANGATPVYYDDLSIEAEQAPPLQPDLEIDTVAGGMGISAVIKNVGEGDATNVAWSIQLDGGLIILGKETSGTIATLAAGNEQAIASSRILGIGKTTITITATCDEGDTATVTKSGFVFLFFVLKVE